MKTCSSCRADLPLESFHHATGRPDGRQRACKACALAYQQSRTTAQKRDTWLRYSYGISLVEFQALADAQGGACRICRVLPTEKDLVVDHAHACCPSKRSCGACIRGLICDPCNRGLGFFRDSPERLIAAAAYIKENKK